MSTAPRVRSGTSRAGVKELTRRRIADAAFAEFEATGYARTTVEDVARRAGTSRATFYVHFGGKADLVEAMWEVTCRDLIALYRELASKSVEERDRAFLDDWLQRTYDFYADHRDRLLAVHEAIALEEQVAEAYSIRIGQVVDLLAPAVEQSRDVPRAEARALALLLTMQHERFCYFTYLRRRNIDTDAARAALGDLWAAQFVAADRGSDQ